MKNNEKQPDKEASKEVANEQDTFKKSLEATEDVECQFTWRSRGHSSFYTRFSL